MLTSKTGTNNHGTTAPETVAGTETVNTATARPLRYCARVFRCSLVMCLSPCYPQG